jgi:hypothetical protein
MGLLKRETTETAKNRPGRPCFRIFAPQSTTHQKSDRLGKIKSTAQLLGSRLGISESAAQLLRTRVGRKKSTTHLMSTRLGSRKSTIARLLGRFCSAGSAAQRVGIRLKRARSVLTWQVGAGARCRFPGGSSGAFFNLPRHRSRGRFSIPADATPVTGDNFQFQPTRRRSPGTIFNSARRGAGHRGRFSIPAATGGSSRGGLHRRELAGGCPEARMSSSGRRATRVDRLDR